MNNKFLSYEKEADDLLKPELSFDIVKRKISVGGKDAVLYFVDGFIKDEVFEKILEYLFTLPEEKVEKTKDMDEFSKFGLPYVETDATYDILTAARSVLCGPAMLIVDGIEGQLIIDTRTYPVRGIEEPSKDRSLRGSRDGFVETLMFNTALLRRRIRTEKLRMEYMQAGQNSKTDIAIAYIDGVADKKTLSMLKERISKIRIKSASMTSQAICESLIPHGILNPFPKFRFTERPDFASAAVLDGKIVMLLDNSPSAVIIPDSFADFFREADDYYFLPVIACYTRVLRFIVTLCTVVISPLYLMLMNNRELIPEFLKFLNNAKIGDIPIIFQLLLLELIVDGLRLASINTPDSLSNSLGIIGGLILSEFAVSAGWFMGETILLTAFVTIAAYSQPSFEMGYAMKFERISLLILTQLFSYYGFIAGLVFWILVLSLNKTLSGKGYFYPVIPFDAKAFIGIFSRKKLPVKK